MRLAVEENTKNTEYNTTFVRQNKQQGKQHFRIKQDMQRGSRNAPIWLKQIVEVKLSMTSIVIE